MTDQNPQRVERADLPDLYRFLMRHAKENQRVLWEQRRLDGLFFHRADVSSDTLAPDVAARCAYWRDAAGTIVGAVFSESPGSYTPHILNESRVLIPAIIEWIRSQKPKTIFCHDEETRWSAPLIAAGYRPAAVEMLSLTCHLPSWQPRPARLGDRYRIRQLQKTDTDAAAMAILLNAAFGRDFHTAAEYSAYQRTAPCYAQTLDLVVDDGTGQLLATAGFTLLGSGDQSLAVLEPVATHPLARRLGCATALLQYGFAAAQRRGIQRLVVGVSAQNSIAQHLYTAHGCVVSAHERAWVPSVL